MTSSPMRTRKRISSARASWSGCGGRGVRGPGPEGPAAAAPSPEGPVAVGPGPESCAGRSGRSGGGHCPAVITVPLSSGLHAREVRSEEHTSELQSRGHLVCRLLLEKKKTNKKKPKNVHHRYYEQHIIRH